MPELNQADVLTRAKQLFEIETGRQWEGGSDKSAPGATDAEQSSYLDKARTELEAVDQEGHS